MPRQLYELLDSFNQKTMLTLRKDVADALFEITGDVHDWLQNKYDEIEFKFKATGVVVSRRGLGDAVRREAWNAVT